MLIRMKFILIVIIKPVRAMLIFKVMPSRQRIISNKLAKCEPLFFILEYGYILDSDNNSPWGHP